MKNAIGQLQAKQTIYCEICGCSYRRTLSAKVYENTNEDKERAREEINRKAAKKYTCRICATIAKDN